MSVHVFVLSEARSESICLFIFFFSFTLHLFRDLSAPVQVLTFGAGIIFFNFSTPVYKM